MNRSDFPNYASMMFACAAIGLSGCQSFADVPQITGDRGNQINAVYPAAAFTEQGGPVIDISRPPYNAKGSGDPADADHNTKAFIAAYDFIMSRLDEVGQWSSVQLCQRHSDLFRARAKRERHGSRVCRMAAIYRTKPR